MIAVLVRDTLRRVPEDCRQPQLDARAQRYGRLLDKLQHAVESSRVGGRAPRVSGLELVLLEGLEIAEEAQRVPGYELVAAVVAGVVGGVAGHQEGEAAEVPADG